MAKHSGTKEARRYRISGRVQGVGYRAFAERIAREIGITGWAQNLGDGRVEVHANGTPAQLEDFEARLRQGPRWSEVRSVEVNDVAVLDAIGFHIR
jgi:acylphosphatase